MGMLDCVSCIVHRGRDDKHQTSIRVPLFCDEPWRVSELPA